MSKLYISSSHTMLRGRRLQTLVVLSVAAMFSVVHASGQVFTLTREQLIKYTAQSPYERFPDGRPNVPDSLLEKLKGMSMEEVILEARGYPNQYVGDLQVLHPGRKLIGRAVTVQFMPTRPDVAEVVQADFKATGDTRRFGHQVAIDMLRAGDVLVVDGYGTVPGIVGDNLAYYVWKTTGTGFVFDGGIRDLEGIAAFDMPGYFRFSAPPATSNAMVTGINVPIRIGQTTVMPGDVVLGDREGVTFIPPHLLEDFVNSAEVTHVHDEWTRSKFDEVGKYMSTDIYGSPRDPALIKEYENYLKEKLSPEGYKRYMERRRSQQPSPAPKEKR